MRFHQIQFGARPLMAVPDAGFSVQRAAVECYPGHTRKKRFLRRIILLGFRSRILKCLAPAKPFTPVGIPASRFDDWLHHLSGLLGEATLWPLVVWPGDPGRGRLYFHFLDGEGAPKAFGKLALDEANGDQIQNEARALKNFQSSPPESFRVPDLLASGTWDGADYLVTACLPATARAVDWEKETGMASVVAEINSPHERQEAVSPPPWWKDLLEACRDFPGLEKVVGWVGQSGWNLGRVHGDLNRTNVMREGDALWVIDWEQSRADGPCRVDELCLEIDQWWNQEGNPGEEECRRFFRALFSGKERSHRAELILALAFLHLLRFSPATTLLQGCQPADFEDVSEQPADQPRQ